MALPLLADEGAALLRSAGISSLQTGWKGDPMKRWFLLSLLALTLAACDTTGSTTQTATPPPTSASTLLTGQLGQAVPVPGWTITITSTRTAESLGSSTPDTPGDVFLIVEVSLQNTGTIDQRANSTQFFLHSPDGTDYGAPYVGVDGLVDIDGLVARGATSQGQLAYAVPPNLHQYTLLYDDSNSQTQAQWQLRV